MRPVFADIILRTQYYNRPVRTGAFVANATIELSRVYDFENMTFFSCTHEATAVLSIVVTLSGKITSIIFEQ